MRCATRPSLLGGLRRDGAFDRRQDECAVEHAASGSYIRRIGRNGAAGAGSQFAAAVGVGRLRRG